MKVKIIEWLIYPETTDRHASKIIRTVQDTEDQDELQKKLNSMYKKNTNKICTQRTKMKRMQQLENVWIEETLRAEGKIENLF